MSSVQIYQLIVRHFGNANTTRKHNGTMLENGCGKFNDISVIALKAIKNMGFTHIWYTGVIEHASGTDYPERAADDEKLLKGIAGSPYAVRDYFDVCPDLAEHVESRLEEFEELLKRTRRVGLEAIIDFVPNHVSRSYGSDIRPDIDFGVNDQTTTFFNQDNNYFYLEGEGEVELPTGIYAVEGSSGKVTGNNANTWSPSKNDWYETVKLNYGHDFRQGADASHLEIYVEADLEKVPDTWQKMDEVLAYWQSLGVRGFRCDMAHMVPVPFWQWVIKRVRGRDPEVYVTGEAYDLDPAKLTHGNILDELLNAGFDSVYDSESYDVVKAIYESGKWANDIDDLLWDETRLHRMLRYVENHDEVRVASLAHWGGGGANVGKAASAVLMGIGKGSVLLYSGQEVAEPADGSEGFCGDNGRTTIFDYWSSPEVCKWVHGHLFDGGGLDDYQKDLRLWYSWWMNTLRQPVFSIGKVYGLNGHNLNNPQFGRLGDEEYSGHWLYAYLRYTTEQSVLVVVNMNPYHVMEDVVIRVPFEMAELLGLSEEIYLADISPCEVKLVKN